MTDTLRTRAREAAEEAHPEPWPGMVPMAQFSYAEGYAAGYLAHAAQQPAREQVAELEAENERLLAERHGPYLCCVHCTQDPEWHAENPPHTHEASCATCDEVYRAQIEQLRSELHESEREHEKTLNIMESALEQCDDYRKRLAATDRSWSEVAAERDAAREQVRQRDEIIARVRALADEWERSYPSLIVGPSIRAVLEGDGR